MADSYTIPPQTPGEDPNHVAAMVAKAEGTSPPESTERLFAGKYKTEEELHKGLLELVLKQNGGDPEAAYKTMEASLGKSETPPETPAALETPEASATPEKAELKNVSSVLARAELNAEEVISSYAETGELKPEYYQALEAKMGLSKEVVNAYLEGQKAIMDRATAAVYSAAGGEEQYNAMIKWASTGISQAEAQAFDATLADGDMAKIQLAVQGLKARYDAVFGAVKSEPKLVGGSATTSAVVGGFRSEAEMTAAMKDPRYNKDPAYTDDVIKKIARSSF